MEGPAFESFEFVEHTADIAVRLRARSVGGLFDMAAAALTDALLDPGSIVVTGGRTVTLEAPELDLLLVDWLQELLFLFETEGFLVARSRVHVDAGERCTLRAEVSGEPRDPARHHLKLLIKAVTYHGLHIERTDDGYAATIIFDI